MERGPKKTLLEENEALNVIPTVDELRREMEENGSALRVDFPGGGYMQIAWEQKQMTPERKQMREEWYETMQYAPRGVDVSVIPIEEHESNVYKMSDGALYLFGLMTQEQSKDEE